MPMKYQVYPERPKTPISEHHKTTKQSMQAALACLSHVLLALDHHLKLVTNLVQPPQHLLIPVRKA